MENVKNLVGKKFKSDFDNWLKYLEGLGYKNSWQILNAKDFGIPQNRERVFCVSILDGEELGVIEKEALSDGNLQAFLEDDVKIKITPSCRKAFYKEIDKIAQSDDAIYYCDVKSNYQDARVGIKHTTTICASNNKTHILERKCFDKNIKLENFLESEVDEKFYIPQEKVEKFINKEKSGKMGHLPKGTDTKISYGLQSREHRGTGWKDISPTLCARDYREPKVIYEPEVIRLGGLFDKEYEDENGDMVSKNTKQGRYMI
jgi:site-specific DNA-cytosine methylase